MSPIFRLAPFSRSTSSRLVDALVLQDALGIAQRAHDQHGVEFGRLDQGLLYIVVDWRFLRGDEAGTHVHAGGPHRQRRDKAPRVGHAARRHERNLQFVRRTGQQDHVRDVVLAGMAAAFEAIDADSVAADLLGLERVPHRGAFVDHLDASGFQRRHILLGAAAGGLHRLDAAFLDSSDIFRIWRRGEARQESKVHTERLVRHVAAARDLLGQ